MPTDPRFALRDWTLEAWVRPSAGWGGNGSVLRREVEPGVTNFFLSVDGSLRPGAGFGASAVWSGDPVVADGTTWTHLAASYASGDRQLRLFINGAQVAVATSLGNPRTVGVVPLVQRIGEGFGGLIEELRVWNVARSESDIEGLRGAPLTGAGAGLVAYYRFDDGTSYAAGSTGTSAMATWDSGQVEEFAAGYADDWTTGWANAGTLHGAAAFTNLAIGESPLDEDRDGDGMPNVGKWRTASIPATRPTRVGTATPTA